MRDGAEEGGGVRTQTIVNMFRVCREMYNLHITFIRFTPFIRLCPDVRYLSSDSPINPRLPLSLASGDI